MSFAEDESGSHNEDGNEAVDGQTLLSCIDNAAFRAGQLSKLDIFSHSKYGFAAGDRQQALALQDEIARAGSSAVPSS